MSLIRKIYILIEIATLHRVLDKMSCQTLPLSTASDKAVTGWDVGWSRDSKPHFFLPSRCSLMFSFSLFPSTINPCSQLPRPIGLITSPILSSSFPNKPFRHSTLHGSHCPLHHTGARTVRVGTPPQERSPRLSAQKHPQKTPTKNVNPTDKTPPALLCHLTFPLTTPRRILSPILSVLCRSL